MVAASVFHFHEVFQRVWSLKCPSDLGLPSFLVFRVLSNDASHVPAVYTHPRTTSQHRDHDQTMQPKHQSSHLRAQGQ